MLTSVAVGAEVSGLVGQLLRQVRTKSCCDERVVFVLVLDASCVRACWWLNAFSPLVFANF